MCKSITTYNSFIRLNRHIHKTRYHTARRINFLSINISLNMNVIMAFNNHCHFFQRSIAGTLTNTIDCHFYLTRSVQDSINSISCRHTQVIMAMSRNNCFINTIHMIYQIFNFRTIFFGQTISCSIRNIHYRSTGLDHRFNYACQILIISSSCIFCIELHIIYKTTGIFHGCYRTFYNFFTSRIEFIFNM